METNPTHNLTMQAGWYRGPEKGWEMDDYGFHPKGLGDLIFNNMKKIVEDGDKSEDALWIFIKCRDLLSDRKRWPIHLEEKPERIAQNIVSSIWSRLLFWLKIKKTKLYRRRGRITRDPFIAFFHCAVMNDWKWAIKQVSIPWYLYSPKTWAWHKFLKDPTEERFAKYDFWCEFDENWKKKDFVIALDTMREATAKEILCPELI